MDEGAIIIQLEELAEKFGVQIRYEAIKQDEDLTFVVGGLCLFKGEYVLIINPKASVKDKIRTFAVALKHFELDQIYIRPVIREILDRIPEQKPFGNASSRHNQQVI
jgi:hypothetical protein